MTFSVQSEMGQLRQAIVHRPGLGLSQLPCRRHRDAEVDGITMRDPDGLEIVLLWIGEKVPAAGPPSWLYWHH